MYTFLCTMAGHHFTLAARWSANHNKVATFSGQWPQRVHDTTSNFSKKKLFKLDFTCGKCVLFNLYYPGLGDFKSAGSVGLVTGF
jgi:hypothetical protein